MRFRHNILIERPGCAVDTFALIADLGRLPERLPGLDVRVVEDCQGGAGHTVEVGGENGMRITVTQLGPGMSIALRCSDGTTQQWRVSDHYEAGCMVTVIVDAEGLVPGEAAEQYRGGLLRDLAEIKRLVEEASA